MATSATSARVGRLEATIESSICVAVIDGRASSPAICSSCFWTIGTSSIGSSIPRSPRATITQSAARRISSAQSTACGFSILAISGRRVCSRTASTSAGAAHEGQRDEVDAGGLAEAQDARDPRPGTAGSSITGPGMLRPWREATVPPISTSASSSPSAGRVAMTRRRIAPSAR